MKTGGTQAGARIALSGANSATNWRRRDGDGAPTAPPIPRQCGYPGRGRERRISREDPKYHRTHTTSTQRSVRFPVSSRHPCSPGRGMRETTLYFNDGAGAAAQKEVVCCYKSVLGQLSPLRSPELRPLWVTPSNDRPVASRCRPGSGSRLCCEQATLGSPAPAPSSHRYFLKVLPVVLRRIAWTQ